MKGKLIVIDGLDATGKQTQVELMRQYLISIGKEQGKDFTTIDFPRYGKESCKAVESYLAGNFGDDPMSLDAFTASLTYAFDRSISYKTESWGKVYNNGGLIIADRYTCSNIIHQGSKIIDSSYMDYEKVSYQYEFDDFINWLYDLEYNRLGIPKPDKIIYLRSSEEAEKQMMEHRKMQEKNHNTDIHEKNCTYLNTCRKFLDAYFEYVNSGAASSLVDSISHSFINIDYMINREIMIKSKEEIHQEILNELNNYF